MNKWTAQQRNQIILLVLGTAAVMALIWFALVAALDTSLREQADKIAQAASQVTLTRAGIAKEPQFRQEIESGKQELDGLEEKMAEGDLFRWGINFLGNIGSRQNVEIADFGPQPQPSELDVPPRVPYKAAAYSIAGTAYYHDFGAFVAALENSSPFIRLNGLTIQAVAPGLAASASPEKLTFRLDVQMLVKPTPTQP